MTEKVLVTGGFGLVGSQTVRRLVEAGHDVIVTDLGTPDQRALPEGHLLRRHGQFQARHPVQQGVHHQLLLQPGELAAGAVVRAEAEGHVEGDDAPDQDDPGPVIPVQDRPHRHARALHLRHRVEEADAEHDLADGIRLVCQSLPASEKLKITYNG